MIGLLAGGITAALPGFAGPGHRFLRPDQLAAGGCCESAGGVLRESWSNARLVARWLALAVVLEVLLQHRVPESWIEQAMGGDNPASIPRRRSSAPRFIWTAMPPCPWYAVWSRWG